MVFQLVTFLLFSFSGYSFDISITAEQNFVAAGGSSKAMSHLSCFLKNHSQTRFRLKSVGSLHQRCNEIETGGPFVSVNKPEYAVVVDYTVPSTKRRFFIVPLTGSEPVESFYVSHGRHYQTPSNNTVPGPGKNTIKWLRYYGNVINSNATSTGFFITGAKYQGMWDGPRDDKYSLIVHGIERGINDNACERAVVIHGYPAIKESGRYEGVRRMSSGCFMLDYDKVNYVVDKLRGKGSFDHPGSFDGGVVLFAYGPREKAMSADHYCESDQNEIFRID